jgi:hypothetical protein
MAYHAPHITFTWFQHMSHEVHDFAKQYVLTHVGCWTTGITITMDKQPHKVWSKQHTHVYIK